MFALIVEYCQIDTLQSMDEWGLLDIEQRVEMIFVLIGRDDSSPCSIEMLPDGFHNKK